jgi:hypothetical protein
LPLHETSETYLAGVVFMVGANFILLGSTKVVAILSIYHDLALGIPTRALGGLLSFGDPKRCACLSNMRLQRQTHKRSPSGPPVGRVVDKRRVASRREMKYEKELEKLLDKQADEVKNIMRAPWNMVPPLHSPSPCDPLEHHYASRSRQVLSSQPAAGA